MPQLSIAPVYSPPARETAPVGLFVDGILVRGVRQVVDNGGDVVMILIGREAFEAKAPAPRIAYPTDGAA